MYAVKEGKEQTSGPSLLSGWTSSYCLPTHQRPPALVEGGTPESVHHCFQGAVYTIHPACQAPVLLIPLCPSLSPLSLSTPTPGRLLLQVQSLHRPAATEIISLLPWALTVCSRAALCIGHQSRQRKIQPDLI